MGSGNETFHIGAAKVMAAGVNKDHLERLHSRVDQQSTLIEMLKQRADKTQHEVRTISVKFAAWQQNTMVGRLKQNRGLFNHIKGNTAHQAQGDRCSTALTRFKETS